MVTSNCFDAPIQSPISVSLRSRAAMANASDRGQSAKRSAVVCLHLLPAVGFVGVRLHTGASYQGSPARFAGWVNHAGWPLVTQAPP